MKLDQIPKKKPYVAPDGYFDTLPGIVQSRIQAEKPERPSQVYVRFGLRYALPVLVLLVSGIFWFRSDNSGVDEFESELAAMDMQNLEMYLEGNELPADEFIETLNPAAIGWSTEELEALENSVYASYVLPGADMNELIDVYEVEPVKDSLQ
jgi:hypothetical protein